VTEDKQDGTGDGTRSRPYRKPALREYGDLRRLTETDVVNRGRPDGGSYGKALTKTSG
jgi:hypothetical protein